MKRMIDLNVGEKKNITGSTIGPGYVIIEDESYACVGNEDLEEPEPEENVNTFDCYYFRIEDGFGAGDGKVFKMVADIKTDEDPYQPWTITVERIR